MKHLTHKLWWSFSDFSVGTCSRKLKSLKGSFSRAGGFSGEVHLREVLGYTAVCA